MKKEIEPYNVVIMYLTYTLFISNSGEASTLKVGAQGCLIVAS